MHEMKFSIIDLPPKPNYDSKRAVLDAGEGMLGLLTFDNSTVGLFRRVWSRNNDCVGAIEEWQPYKMATFPKDSNGKDYDHWFITDARGLIGERARRPGAAAKRACGRARRRGPALASRKQGTGHARVRAPWRAGARGGGRRRPGHGGICACGARAWAGRGGGPAAARAAERGVRARVGRLRQIWKPKEEEVVHGEPQQAEPFG
ncbi:unnamed protein product [Urochloa humidicola]